MTNRTTSFPSASRARRPNIGLLTAALFTAAGVWTGCSAGGGSPAPSDNGTGGSGYQSGSGGAFQGSSGSGNGNGAAGSGVTQLDGGGFQSKPVDPSILFNYTVGGVDLDNPNTKLVCQPGHYKGVFGGVYAPALTFVGAPVPVVGDVEMYLAQGQNGEFLTITNGVVSGNADFLADYRCDITGTLDCTLKKIVHGALSNCNYCVGRFAGDGGSAICLGVEGHFKGPLGADYDAANDSLINGTWKGKEGSDAGVFGGFGTWNANYVGP